MKNERSAFTLIQLIFVIVIIGILAGVAMSKLAATRDDAFVSKEVANIKQAIQDMGMHCIAKGEFGTWADMTNLQVTNQKNQNKTRYKLEDYNCVVFTRGDTNVLNVKINNKGYKKSRMCQLVSDRLIELKLAAKNPGVDHTFCGTSSN